MMNQQNEQAYNEDAMVVAKICTDSLANSALTIEAYSTGNANMSTLIERLHNQVDKVIDGDTRRIETMLMTQAQTLDAIFHKMMRNSMSVALLPQSQVYTDLGFKAQNQCRKALLALAEIKNPKRATFIKQQNNAINQQVNNGVNSENLKKSKNITNELLSEESHEALEFGRAAEAIAVDSQLESLGAVNGGENRNR